MKNILDFRVIYKDTDAEGVVYYANYLGWFEAGRTEFLRQAGITLPQLKNEYSLVFAVREINCEYLKPAAYDDEVTIETEIAEIKPVRIVFSQRVLRKSDSQELTRARVTVIPLNIKSFKPQPLPDGIKARFTSRT